MFGFGLGPTELMIFGAIAVMLFGSKLPELARSLGGSYREFRKGLTDIQSQMNINPSFDAKPQREDAYAAADEDDYEDYSAPAAPKFEPPTAPPTDLAS